MGSSGWGKMDKGVTGHREDSSGIDGADGADLALLRRVGQQDRSAFASLYTRFYRRLHRFLRRMVCQDDQVEELINDVMLTVWQKASDFHGRSRTATWILGIAYKKALKRLRSNTARKEDAWEVPPELVDSMLPEQALLNGERHLAVSRALTALSVEHRAVVTLTFFHGYSYAEIASIVQCPPNTVKTRMLHARKHLRQLLPEAKPWVSEE